MDGAGLVGAGWAENTLTIGRRVEQTSDLYPQGSNDDFWFPFRPNQSFHICVWVMKYYWIMLDYSSLCVIHPNEVLSRFINYMIWCSHAGNHSFADHLLCSLGRGATLAAKQIGRNQVNLKMKKVSLKTIWWTTSPHQPVTPMAKPSANQNDCQATSCLDLQKSAEACIKETEDWSPLAGFIGTQVVSYHVIPCCVISKFFVWYI